MRAGGFSWLLLLLRHEAGAPLIGYDVAVGHGEWHGNGQYEFNGPGSLPCSSISLPKASDGHSAWLQGAANPCEHLALQCGLPASFASVWSVWSDARSCCSDACRLKGRTAPVHAFWLVALPNPPRPPPPNFCDASFASRRQSSQTAASAWSQAAAWLRFQAASRLSAAVEPPKIEGALQTNACK